MEKIKTYSAEIKRQNERLEFLIDSLTKLSRLENGTLELVLNQSSVNELINAAVSAIHPKAEKKNIKIIVPSENVENSANFDLKWTCEALVNILDNAVKYAPENSEIKIEAEAYEMYLSIHVIDEGQGISEEDMTRIFGRFFRGESVQQEEGVGIGLYLAREILAKEDGYIKAVPNNVRKGGEFVIYLRR